MGQTWTCKMQWKQTTNEDKNSGNSIESILGVKIRIGDLFIYFQCGSDFFSKCSDGKLSPCSILLNFNDNLKRINFFNDNLI